MAEGTSEVDVCNSALTMLGEDVIASLEDGSTRAVLCNQHFHKQRNAVLRRYPWNFALKRQTLAALVASPDWGYSYQYPLPSDCLRVWNVEHLARTEWKVRQGKILTDEGSCKIEYVARVTDMASWDALALDALAARLAATICVGLNAKRTLAESLWALYQAKIDEAEEIDSQEGEPETVDDDHDIIAVR